MSTVRLTRAGLFGAFLVVAAACGNAATTTLAPSASAALTPAPSAAASASAVPAETPAATAPPEGGGGPIAEAAVAKLQSDPLITHVNQVATVSAAGQDASVEASIDLSGDDSHVVMNITSGGRSSVQEVVIIGDDAWVRTAATDPFTKVSTSALGATVEQLYKAVRLVDDPQSLRFVGTETIGGMELQHLTAVGTIPYAPASGGTGTYDAFDLWVLEDGTPVIARTEFSATDASGLDASGATDFEFTNFGGPITIEPPVAGS